MEHPTTGTSNMFQRSLHIAKAIITVLPSRQSLHVESVKAAHYFAVSPEEGTRAEGHKTQCNLNKKGGREGYVKDFEHLIVFFRIPLCLDATDTIFRISSSQDTIKHPILSQRSKRIETAISPYLQTKLPMITSPTRSVNKGCITTERSFC